MSIFNANNIKEDLFKGTAEHPEGTFDGNIVKVESAKTSSGHRVLNVSIKTEEGMLRNGINLDHPNCASISQKTIGQMLASYETPPTKADTLQELADLLQGLPVTVHVKHKGKNDKGYTQYAIYHNEIKPERRVSLEAGTPVRKVEY
jgi:hypothetical protein